MHPGIRWLQLPGAGVERWLASGATDSVPIVTLARGTYGGPVAEHAFALILASCRQLGPV